MTTMTTDEATFQYAPAAKYAPARDFTYQTEGAEIARLMRLMGRRLMPWQRQVIDVATEYRLDAFGRRVYHYATVMITVPRQSGKTTIMGPVKLHRIMTRPGIDCFSTAQTGKDAGKRMKDLITFTVGSPLASVFKPRYSNGSEGLTVSGNGSSLTRFAPTAGAIHGETPHMVDFDEIWKYTEALGDAMLGGVGPAMITLGGQAQTWMISTMGTAQSGFMNKWVEAGRTGTDATLAYFEWSMPAGLDPYDPDTWWTFHPALGNTIDADALQLEATKQPYAEWMRAYMNVLVEAVDPIIGPEDWAALATEPEGRPARSDLSISYEVAPENACGAVMATWRDDAGMPCTRVLHQAPGTAWMVPYLRRIVAEWAPAVLAADDGGPVRRITDRLETPEDDAASLEVFKVGMREFGTACDGLLSAATEDKTLRHDGSAPLAVAVANAVVRTTNGIGRLDRDRSTAPIPSLIGAAVGLWAYDHRDAPTGRQIF